MELKSGYKQTEVGVIPKDWDCLTVREIASRARNATVGGPFGSDLVSNDYVDYGVPVIRGQNMSGQWVSGSFVFVTPAKAKSLSANLAHPNDIVFTQRGTLGQVSIVPDQPFESYLVSQSQMKLSVNLQIADPLFLFYVFTSDDQQELIRGGTIQTGVPHLNLGILRNIPVQIPPLPEQRAIAEVLSDTDALIRSLDQLIAKKRDIKQAAMQQLLTGKRRLPGFSGEWEEKRLGECLSKAPDYGINAAAVPYDDRFPTYLRITDISEDGKYLKAGKVSVDNPLAKEYYLDHGDIVFARTGASVGKAFRYDTHDGALVFAGFLIRVKVNPQLLDSRFLFFVTQTKSYWDWVIEHSMRSGQPGLNSQEYKALPLSVPTPTEQLAIIEILGDMDAEITALEVRREKTRLLKQGMMQELLTGRIRLV